MKRIFLDTNFIIDYLLRTEYKKDCVEFMALCRRNGAKFYISFLSVANFAYIARKLPKPVLNAHLSALLDLFTVQENTVQQLRTALNIDTDDFEDALQYVTALDAKCECIITRNEKDFKFAKLPVMSAQEYMSKL